MLHIRTISFGVSYPEYFLKLFPIHRVNLKFVLLNEVK